MFGLGTGELVVIFLVIFILFGPKALPNIARSLGKALKDFKKELSDLHEKSQMKDPARIQSDDQSKKSA